VRASRNPKLSFLLVFKLLVALGRKLLDYDKGWFILADTKAGTGREGQKQFRDPQSEDDRAIL
jgi:hypothetical protein